MLANQLTRVTLLTTSLQCGQTGSVVSHRLSKVLGRGPHDMMEHSDSLISCCQEIAVLSQVC